MMERKMKGYMKMWRKVLCTTTKMPCKCISLALTYIWCSVRGFSRWTTGFHRQAKLFELNFSMRKTFFEMVKPAN